MITLEEEFGRLDAAREWGPWEPAPDEPWDLKRVGHLYRRAAFAAHWSELTAAVKAGPEAAVDRLFEGGPGRADFDELMDAAAPAQTFARPRFNPNDPSNPDLEGWWLHRMVLTPHPLQERMTLFWHNHFATSINKVKLPVLMRDQNFLFRRHALGKFDALVQEVSKDSAMLVWLDSNSNIKGNPNENYARELMELFCLGVGNYTEKDVREAARAFTGWHTNANPNGGLSPTTPAQFVFQPSQHDDGEKTVLGKTGNWDGADVVRIVLGQPSCSRFVVRKLYRHFVSEAAVPPDSLIEPLAEKFRASGFDIAVVLKTILRSRHFYSRFAHRQRVKSPVEFIVGLLRSLEATLPADIGSGSLGITTEGVGQALFAPPTVKGWDGAKAWLNTATLLGRHNTAWDLLQEPGGPAGTRVDPSAVVARHLKARDANAQVAFLLDLLLQPGPGDIDGRGKTLVASFLGEESSATARGRQLREAAHAIVCMPLYQLA